MSEFSCSYHLKSESIDDCVSLIKRANVSGYIFPPKDGWVSFVTDEPDFEFSENLIGANEGVLLNFSNAEDHGWSFEIYNGKEKVCQFMCDYIEGIKCTPKNGIENRNGLFNKNQAAMLDRLFAMDNNTPLDEWALASDFAVGMGLYFYDWVSYSYVSSGPFTSYGEYDNLELTEVLKESCDESGDTYAGETSDETSNSEASVRQYKPDPEAPDIEWVLSLTTTVENREPELEYEEDVGLLNIIRVGDSFVSLNDFINTGKETKGGITIYITGKNIDNESIVYERARIFKHSNIVRTAEDTLEAETNLTKCVLKNGSKAYFAEIKDIELPNSISMEEYWELFKIKSPKVKGLLKYQIRIYGKILSIDDHHDARITIHHTNSSKKACYAGRVFDDDDVFR